MAQGIVKWFNGEKGFPQGYGPLLFLLLLLIVRTGFDHSSHRGLDIRFRDSFVDAEVAQNTGTVLEFQQR